MAAEIDRAYVKVGAPGQPEVVYKADAGVDVRYSRSEGDILYAVGEKPTQRIDHIVTVRWTEWAEPLL